jgi:hypothetical protein
MSRDGGRSDAEVRSVPRVAPTHSYSEGENTGPMQTLIH